MIKNIFKKNAQDPYKISRSKPSWPHKTAQDFMQVNVLCSVLWAQDVPFRTKGLVGTRSPHKT